MLVPIILNTYGAVGEKAIEFLYAVAGAKAKGIVDEISMLAVLLSADMILQSHAPSNLSNLTSLPSPAKQAAEPVEQPAVRGQEEEVEKDEAGFLRPELRGEVRGNQVECLGCSTEGKKIFRCGILWNWNRHVQLKHNKNVAQPAASAGTSKSKPASISGASKCRSIQPKSGLGVDTAENGPRKGRKTKSGLGVDTAENEPRKGRKIGGPQKASTATASKRKAAAPPVLHTTLVLPAQPAAQLHHVPQASDDSVANIFPFRTSTAAHGGDVDNVFGEERFCETVSSINPDRIRSQTEAPNSQVRHFDSSFPRAGPVDTAPRASIFSKTNNASQMFSSTDN